MTGVPQHWFSLCSFTGKLGCVKIILSFERKNFWDIVYYWVKRSGGGWGICYVHIENPLIWVYAKRYVHESMILTNEIMSAARRKLFKNGNIASSNSDKLSLQE